MKIQLRPEERGERIRRNEAGLTTFMFIILLAIMVLLAGAESMALGHLHREVKLLEKQQIKRLAMPQTNSIPARAAEPHSIQ